MSISDTCVKKPFISLKSLLNINLGEGRPPTSYTVGEGEGESSKTLYCEFRKKINKKKKRGKICPGTFLRTVYSFLRRRFRSICDQNPDQIFL